MCLDLERNHAGRIIKPACNIEIDYIQGEDNPNRLGITLGLFEFL